MRWAVVLILVFVFLRWFEHAQTFHPSRSIAPPPPGWNAPFEVVSLTTSDHVRIEGWFFPAKPGAGRSNQVWILLHGNAGNVSHRFPLYQVLLETGMNVLAVDYRGYGRSRGRPGEEGTYRDAEAAWLWLTSARQFASTNVFVIGESLGGAVAAELALRRPVGGIVLQGSFTSLPAVGAELFPWLPVRWISSMRYDTRSKLPRLHVPVLILHSRADQLVGFHHAEANFAAANEPKRLWELKGGHNDALWAGEREYGEGLEAFLGMIPPGRKTD